MAMNKKEKAELDKLKQELRLAKALRWTVPIEPDVSPPPPFTEMKRGWLYNDYITSARVEPACASSHFHAFGQTDRTTTQGTRSLFSSRLLALKALRHRLELKCAEILAKIDKDIEEIEGDKMGKTRMS